MHGQTSLALLRDNAARNLLVSRLRNDLPRHELALVGVGPVLYDRGRVSIANAGKRLEIVLRCRVDVDQLARSRATWRFRCFGRLVWRGNQGQGRE